MLSVIVEVPGINKLIDALPYHLPSTHTIDCDWPPRSDPRLVMLTPPSPTECEVQFGHPRESCSQREL